MKFEIRWSPDDKPKARRVDGHPMTDDDRKELRALIEKVNRCEVCFNCGSPWSLFTNPAGEKFFVCWVCAKSA
jgi:hypothetical protein